MHAHDAELSVPCAGSSLFTLQPLSLFRIQRPNRHVQRSASLFVLCGVLPLRGIATATGYHEHVAVCIDPDHSLAQLCNACGSGKPVQLSGELLRGSEARWRCITCRCSRG